MGSQPAIVVDNLTFAYSERNQVLDQVSFQVAANETLALVGPNGAGKTTLFLCLAGVLPLKSGMAMVAGLDPSQRQNRRLLPERLGIVFQISDEQIFNPTVFDDVAFGPLNLGLPANEVKQRVADALADVGLSDAADRVPFHLSGGEKRRVALAGVLAMKPEILLLDEPTSHLDPRNRRELIQLLQQLKAAKMLATHDLEMVLELCTRVLLLDEGRLIADGDPARILSDANLMDAHGLEVPYSLRK